MSNSRDNADVTAIHQSPRLVDKSKDEVALRLNIDSAITLSAEDTESDNGEDNSYLPPFSRTNIIGAGNLVENGQLKAVKSIELLKQAMIYNSPMNSPKYSPKAQLAQITRTKTASKTKGRFAEHVAEPEPYRLLKDRKQEHKNNPEYSKRIKSYN